MKWGAVIFIAVILLLSGCSQDMQEAEDIPEAKDTQEVKTMAGLKITSPVFEQNGNIPSKYTCDGEDINPPLNIEGIPEGTQSLVLIVDDPDAPVGTWDHWVVWNIEPADAIKENSVPGTQGMNSFGKRPYGGPCPPSGTHRYFFKLYALDTKLDLDPGSGKADAESAMKGHTLAKAEIIGVYKRG